MYEFLPSALEAIRTELGHVIVAIEALETYARSRSVPGRAVAESLLVGHVRRGRPPMSEEERKIQSERMKAYWAKRKTRNKDR